MLSDHPDSGRPATGVLRRGLISLAVFILILAAIMFVPGGIKWWQGWLFLAVFILQIAVAAIYLWRRNPEIFVARSRFRSETKSWDKVLAISLLLPSLMAEFPVGQKRGAEKGTSLICGFAPWSARAAEGEIEA